MSNCTYCGRDLSNDEPVWLSEGRGDDRSPVGGFCNYACLHEYIEDDGLVYGASCAWSSGAS